MNIKPPAKLRSALAFHIDEPLSRDQIVTPAHICAPEILLNIPGPFGAGIDIWSFGCLAFFVLTGRYLFGGFQATEDMSLVQFSEILGPLPADMFAAWERGASYFGPDRISRRSETLPEGEEDTSNLGDIDYFDHVDLDGKDQSEDAESGCELSGSCSPESADDPLEVMPVCSLLEQIFKETKP